MFILHCEVCQQPMESTKNHVSYICPLCGLKAAIDSYQAIMEPTEVQTLYFMSQMRERSIALSKWLATQLKRRK